MNPRISLGYYLWVLGRPAEAEVELKKAVELEPDNAAANRMLSLFYISQNRVDDAETPLIRLANRKDERAMQTLSDLYIRTGRPDKAKSVLETLKETKGTRTFAATRLAQIDYAAGRTQEAHNAVAAELKGDQNNPELLSLQARWFAAERKTQDALEAAKKAATAAPESAEVQSTLGLVYAARNENEEATRAFTEALRLNPRANAAELQLSRLLLVQGNVEQGLAHARSVVRAAPRRRGRPRGSRDGSARKGRSCRRRSGSEGPAQGLSAETPPPIRFRDTSSRSVETRPALCGRSTARSN